MSTRKFSIGNQQAMDQKFIEFEGTNEDGEPVLLRYELKKMINGKVLTSAIWRASQGAVAELEELLPFIRRCIKSTDQERFDADLERDDVAIPSRVLGEVWNYCVEVYSAAPLGGQSGSSSGQPTTSGTSTGTPSSTESVTSESSTPTDGATQSSPSLSPTVWG